MLAAQCLRSHGFLVARRCSRRSIQICSSASLVQKAHQHSVVEEATRYRCSSVRLFGSVAIRKNREALNIQASPVRDVKAQQAAQTVPENALYTKRIQRLGRQKRWDEAKSTFDGIPQKNAIVYGAIMAAADQCKRYEEGIALFTQMQAEGFEANAVHYGMLLSTLAMARDFSEVEKALNHAREQGIHLNQVHYGGLVKSCREARDPGRALEVIRMMRSDPATRASIVHYTMVMVACSRARVASQMNDEDVRRYIDILDSEMVQDGVLADKFYLEERVRAVLGGAPLQEILSEQGIASLTQSQIQSAMSTIETAKKNGTEESRLLQEVADHLNGKIVLGTPRDSALGGHAVDTLPPLPSGWHETVDKVTGHTSYWNDVDPSGTTTWTRPARLH